jgi:protein-disulfide isomerase
MTSLFRCILVLAIAIGAASAARADEFTPAQRAEIVQILRDALKRDPSILRDAIAAMNADDSAKHAAALAAAVSRIVDPNDPMAGNPKGNVTIVYFFDTRCPYCRKLEPTMADFLAKDGNVRLVYKDLPILGPDSVLGSKALLAAQKQGGYEKLRSVIMAAPPELSMATLRDDVQQVGLNWDQLQHDMDDPRISARITANLTLARSIGIDGTPALVIGQQLIPGAVDISDLADAVAAARAAKPH